MSINRSGLLPSSLFSNLLYLPTLPTWCPFSPTLSTLVWPGQVKVFSILHSSLLYLPTSSSPRAFSPSTWWRRPISRPIRTASLILPFYLLYPPSPYPLLTSSSTSTSQAASLFSRQTPSSCIPTCIALRHQTIIRPTPRSLHCFESDIDPKKST